MLRILLDNIGSAVLALFLAVTIWVLASSEQNPPREDFYRDSLPIEVVNRPEGLVLYEEVDHSVMVKLRAPETSWGRLQAKSFRAYVDLADLAPGLHEIAVQVQVADPLVTVLEKDPATVTMRLEELRERKMSVQANVIGSPPLGYILRPLVVSPSEVVVKGPQTLVEQTSEVVVEVALLGAKSTFEREFPVVAQDSRGKPIPRLEISPSMVMVQVPIEQRLGYKDVSVKAVTQGTVAPGYWISNIRVEPSTLMVVGSPAVIEAIAGFVETEVVDISDVKGNVIKRVGLVVPEGVSILNEQSVLVRIDVTAVQGGQTVQREPVARGLALGLQTTISPEVVDVILSGPLPVLQELELEDVQVIVDLVNKEPGTYKIQPTVIAPTSLNVESIVPDSVEVVIAAAEEIEEDIQ
ncbi:MAG: YbbR-like domain-containing protein [Anaerolineae bacterium]